VRQAEKIISKRSKTKKEIGKSSKSLPAKDLNYLAKESNRTPTFTNRCCRSSKSRRRKIDLAFEQGRTQNPCKPTIAKCVLGQISGKRAKNGWIKNSSNASVKHFRAIFRKTGQKHKRRKSAGFAVKKNSPQQCINVSLRPTA